MCVRKLSTYWRVSVFWTLVIDSATRESFARIYVVLQGLEDSPRAALDPVLCRVFAEEYTAQYTVDLSTLPWVFFSCKGELVAGVPMERLDLCAAWRCCSWYGRQQSDSVNNRSMHSNGLNGGLQQSLLIQCHLVSKS